MPQCRGQACYTACAGRRMPMFPPMSQPACCSSASVLNGESAPGLLRSICWRAAPTSWSHPARTSRSGRSQRSGTPGAGPRGGGRLAHPWASMAAGRREICSSRVCRQASFKCIIRSPASIRRSRPGGQATSCWVFACQLATAVHLPKAGACARCAVHDIGRPHCCTVDPHECTS